MANGEEFHLVHIKVLVSSGTEDLHRLEEDGDIRWVEGAEDGMAIISVLISSDDVSQGGHLNAHNDAILQPAGDCQGNE